MTRLSLHSFNTCRASGQFGLLCIVVSCLNSFLLHLIYVHVMHDKIHELSQHLYNTMNMMKDINLIAYKMGFFDKLSVHEQAYEKDSFSLDMVLP